VLNAILYEHAMAAHRLLTFDFPARETVYGYFREWTSDGTWQRIHETLRAAQSGVP
jgi:putative transposase